MKIKGIDGMSTEQINNEVRMGGKFVVYQYCISIILMTFKRGSNIYFIKSGENAFTKGLGYTLLSLILGWWGIPWGPIYTIGAVVNNCKGGKDVTEEIGYSLREQATRTPLAQMYESNISQIDR